MRSPRIIYLLLCAFLSLVKADKVKVTHKVTLHITQNGDDLGEIVIGLFGETVPKTVKNFAELASMQQDGYVGTKFHRVISGFMIQGGDVENKDGHGSKSFYGGRFEDENFDIKHGGPGFVSMANSGPNTNGCQFFITCTKTNWLDGKHVVFGKVLSGMNVVTEIENTDVDVRDHPTVPIFISKATVLPLEFNEEIEVEGQY